MDSDNGDPTTSSATTSVEAFDPATVRPWRYHNRRASGMDDVAIDALALSIRRDGQQQPGLARRLPPGDTHVAEAIFGVRRLEACRRVGVPWRAEVRDGSFPDDDCAALMHGENEWSTGVSPLENALQWKAMLDARVFKNQTALADRIGCHRAKVSRGLRTATLLFGEPWIERFVFPVMHDLTGRSAERLADACTDPDLSARAKRRARRLVPGTIPAKGLYDALFGQGSRDDGRETLFERHRGPGDTGPVTARIQREADGGWLVRVRPHEQTPAQQAELAEEIEALLATETTGAAAVRVGRRLVALLSAEDAKTAQRSWLEGCVWTAARAVGLDWDRWRCSAIADLLRSQPDGWEAAVARAVGGRDASPSGQSG